MKQTQSKLRVSRGARVDGYVSQGSATGYAFLVNVAIQIAGLDGIYLRPWIQHATASITLRGEKKIKIYMDGHSMTNRCQFLSNAGVEPLG